MRELLCGQSPWISWRVEASSRCDSHVSMESWTFSSPRRSTPDLPPEKHTNSNYERERKTGKVRRVTSTALRRGKSLMSVLPWHCINVSRSPMTSCGRSPVARSGEPHHGCERFCHNRKKFNDQRFHLLASNPPKERWWLVRYNKVHFHMSWWHRVNQIYFQYISIDYTGWLKMEDESISRSLTLPLLTMLTSHVRRRRCFSILNSSQKLKKHRN